jgi:hypothetical protein
MHFLTHKFHRNAFLTHKFHKFLNFNFKTQQNFSPDNTEKFELQHQIEALTRAIVGENARR